MAHPNKSKMAAAAIFNFGQNINNFELDAPNFMGSSIKSMQR